MVSRLWQQLIDTHSSVLDEEEYCWVCTFSPEQYDWVNGVGSHREIHQSKIARIENRKRAEEDLEDRQVVFLKQ